MARLPCSIDQKILELFSVEMFPEGFYSSAKFLKASRITFESSTFEATAKRMRKSAESGTSLSRSVSLSKSFIGFT